MSDLLLDAALGADESDSMSDSEAANGDSKDEKPLHEAMSHTTTEGMHVETRRLHWSRHYPKTGGHRKSLDLKTGGHRKSLDPK